MDFGGSIFDRRAEMLWTLFTTSPLPMQDRGSEHSNMRGGRRLMAKRRNGVHQSINVKVEGLIRSAGHNDGYGTLLYEVRLRVYTIDAGGEIDLLFDRTLYAYSDDLVEFLKRLAQYERFQGQGEEDNHDKPEDFDIEIMDARFDYETYRVEEANWADWKAEAELLTLFNVGEGRCGKTKFPDDIFDHLLPPKASGRDAT
jgi:hypothetical protein